MIVTHDSCVLAGLQSLRVQVEVDLSNGLPKTQIVGLPDSTVQEAGERVRAAIRNSGYEFPLKRVTINLAPADVKKEGSGFDLPMALGILEASCQFPRSDSRKFLIVGELGLDGTVRSVPGVLAMLGSADEESPKDVIIPHENLGEASIFPDIRVWPVKSLQEASAVLAGEKSPMEQKTSWQPEEEWPLDFQSVKGQEQAKRAFEIAAAGNHNLLLVGPPGSGKTMLAKRLPGILPEFGFEESLEISKILSVVGLLAGNKGLARHRPFRAPHCSISYAGMVGGGNPIRPGELSLAHRGVLFLDELPEFHRDVLEGLRQPLEEHCVTVVRLNGTVSYPANFLFVGAMNPCPCGFYGDLTQSCVCRPADRLNYRKRISGPVLDRVDLHVEVFRLQYEHFYGDGKPEKSETIRRRVRQARKIQQERLRSRLMGNGDMDSDAIEQFCPLTREAKDLLKKAFNKLRFSARGHTKVLKIARTIADLAGSREIELIHLAEALQYRVLDRNIY